ncbi:hypothetical protein FNV43_RR04510 [Rhamnella rubrinervis]|uniref:Uncharacterized protein n=1 Tax=Rhamnella rubrinervis TaxID=2594499 RepID=A0A8K0HM31_9ROSA|nr:hypothetical protein FNV43_RR04510 [Rhamnella rubrinervis]
MVSTLGACPLTRTAKSLGITAFFLDSGLALVSARVDCTSSFIVTKVDPHVRQMWRLHWQLWMFPPRSPGEVECHPHISKVPQSLKISEDDRWTWCAIGEVYWKKASHDFSAKSRSRALLLALNCLCQILLCHKPLNSSPGLAVNLQSPKMSVKLFEAPVLYQPKNLRRSSQLIGFGLLNMLKHPALTAERTFLLKPSSVLTTFEPRKTFLSHHFEAVAQLSSRTNQAFSEPSNDSPLRNLVFFRVVPLSGFPAQQPRFLQVNSLGPKVLLLSNLDDPAHSSTLGLTGPARWEFCLYNKWSLNI